MTRIHVEPPEAGVWSPTVKRLLDEGRRSFLFCGEADRLGRELHEARDARATVAVCAAGARDADPGLSILSPEEAFAAGQAWDVVVLAGAATEPHLAARVLTAQRLPEIVVHRQPAEAALVVSIHKSGTHLVAELLRALGYQVIGPMGGAEDRPSPFDLLGLQGSPRRRAVLVHWLELEPRHYVPLKAWAETGTPRILYNYRDPRDVVCSYVHYLLGDTGRPVTRIAQHMIRERIVQHLATHEQRIAWALREPDVVQRHFRACEWLLLHPDVCKLAFEKLVGAAGGGDDDAQLRQVAGAMIHLGAAGEPATLARSIFNREARTFHRGQSGAWRRELGPREVQLANELLGDILDVYGYPRG